ncbi:hypothetical protein AB205_0009530, partial [Aquarana catesbeiana]
MAWAGSGTFEFITGKDRMQPKSGRKRIRSPSTTQDPQTEEQWEGEDKSPSGDCEEADDSSSEGSSGEGPSSASHAEKLLVLRALKCSLQPTVKDISLTWTLPSSVEAIVLSKVPTAIFHGQKSIVYAQLKGKVENEADGEVCLQYKFKDEIIKNDLRFPLKVQNAERPTIHRLAAKTLISELEHGTESPSEDVKKKILETSLQSGVVSSLSAYVAVNKDTKTHVEGPPMRRDVPA